MKSKLDSEISWEYKLAATFDRVATLAVSVQR